MQVAQLTRKHDISAATYYHWKSKCAGAGLAELKRLRELEAENAKFVTVAKSPSLTIEIF